jgi:predicted DsbA family dithiol-disulfide isomerase
MRAMGRGDGIDFTSQGLVGNTRDAHRLVQLAKTKSLTVQDKVMEQLFLSYFENGGDVTSHDMLVAAAEKGGLDPAEAKEWLARDSGGPEVDKEVSQSYGEGISGVPNFTIDGKYQINGAQDVTVFLQQLVAAKENSAAGGQTNGLTC